jgi:hypothetical protein
MEAMYGRTLGNMCYIAGRGILTSSWKVCIAASVLETQLQSEPSQALVKTLGRDTSIRHRLQRAAVAWMEPDIGALDTEAHLCPRTMRSKVLVLI